MNLLHYVRDLFVSRSPSKDERNANLVKNPKAIKEDRWAALQYFEDHPDREIALKALLPRFDYSLEHGILDTREKDLALKGVSKFGKDVIPLVAVRLKETNRIAWPIKILKSLGDESIVVRALLDALSLGDTTFDEAAKDKNYDILCHLVDYKLSKDQWSLITPFVSDSDERVRFATVEVLMEQDFDIVAPLLEKYLSDETPDNSRIRQTVIKTYLERQWPVKEVERFPNGRVVGPVFVGPSKTLELRQ